MSQNSFISHLSSSVLIGDGAMGTYIYAKGIPLGRCYDELNLINSHLIRFIHKEYVDAGADLIETNTFTANRLRLKRFELEKKVKEINYQGAKIAKEVAGKSVYVAGSVGPLTGAKREDEITLDEKYDIFAEQVVHLADGGCDVIILETFTDLDELKCALRAVKEKTNLPAICQMTFSENTKTPLGVGVIKAFTELEKAGADVVGANCGVGPLATLKVVEEMCRLSKVKVSAFPNAGMPQYVDSRYMYLSTPEYIAGIAKRMVQAGANLVGGCCGTTPTDIRAIAQKLKGVPLVPRRIITRRMPKVEKVAVAEPPEKRAFLDRIGEDIVMVAEVDPPKGMDVERALKVAVKLKKAGVDAITLGDNPLAVLRMGNIGVAHLMEKEGIQTIAHLSCRDRNLIGIQSAIMEASALGITSILAITGDPAKVGDQPAATSVYDLNSFSLIKLLKQMNSGKNYAGNPIQRPTNFSIGCAFNPNVQDIDAAIRRIVKKVEAGADFALSQPFYDIDRIGEIYEELKEAVGKFPVLFGVLPPVSARNAEYLNAEVPGIKIPQTIINRLKEASEDKQCREGIAISKELISEAMKYAPGMYLILPFGKVNIALELVEYIKANRLERAKSKR